MPGGQGGLSVVLTTRTVFTHPYVLYLFYVMPSSLGANRHIKETVLSLKTDGTDSALSDFFVMLPALNIVFC